MDMPKFKDFTKAELEEINDLFESYLFYESLPSGAKHFECSHCNQEFKIGFPQRMISDDEYTLYTTQHNGCAKCPKCGRVCTVKNIGKAKTCKNLYEEQRVVAIHRINENYVQVIGRVAVKDYSGLSYRPKIRFLPYNQSNYVFRPGRVTQYKRDSVYSNWHETKTASEPFTPKTSMWYYTPPDNTYTIIGVKQLDKTFLRYNRLLEYIDHYTEKRMRRGCIIIEPPIMRYLCRFCEYPQIEILQKFGFWEYIEFLVESGKKCFPYVSWKASDVCGFFKMNKQDFKLFRENGGSFDLLKIKVEIKRLVGKDDMQTVLKWCNLLSKVRMYDYFSDVSEKYTNLPIYRKLKYIAKQADKENTTVENARHLFFDYLDLAKKLKYDLENEVVLWPKNLKASHDTAVEVYNAVCAQKEAEAQKEREKKAKKFLCEYKRLYCFSDENFMIMVPTTAEEIILEGKQQHHCVGGYAARHLEGKLAICFLRSKNEPDKPLYTIEMHGKKLRQIQGYANSTPLTPEAEIFFETWKAWVKAGSHRDRKGNPKFVKINKGE